MAERLQLPQSGGGLVRYSEDYKSRFVMSPVTVIAMIIAVILIEIALHVLG